MEKGGREEEKEHSDMSSQDTERAFALKTVDNMVNEICLILRSVDLADCHFVPDTLHV